MNVPFLDFAAGVAEIRSELLAAVARVLDRGVTILGPEGEAFEDEFARHCGARHAIGVSNGLDALSLVLRAADIGPGDEVIVPSQTFVASWLAVSHVGARPVSVDIDPETYTLAPAAIEAAITQRTRAVMPVHLFGHPADMDAIMAVARRHGLFVLEDAAQAQGAGYKDRRCGSIGHAAGFSFYPTKNLGALGDAGAIVTNDAALAERLRKLRNYGSSQKYVHEVIGYNARLDEVQAAVLRVKLQHLDAWNDRRRAVAGQYAAELSGTPGIVVPGEAPWARHVYHLYVVQSPRRDALAEHLRSQGIHSLIHYPIPPGQQEIYRNGDGGMSTPVGDAAAERSLSLPIWPQMSREAVEATARAIRGFAEQAG